LDLIHCGGIYYTSFEIVIIPSHPLGLLDVSIVVRDTHEAVKVAGCFLETDCIVIDTLTVHVADLVTVAETTRLPAYRAGERLRGRHKRHCSQQCCNGSFQNVPPIFPRCIKAQEQSAVELAGLQSSLLSRLSCPGKRILNFSAGRFLANASPLDSFGRITIFGLVARPLGFPE
jgi:hypothetical protein